MRPHPDIHRPLRVINCHDQDKAWNWIAPLYAGEPEVEWHSISTSRRPLLRRLPGPHWGRVRAAIELRSRLRRVGADLVVSHGPYTSYYVEALSRPRRFHVPHLAFAFNFTDIPSGYRLKKMQEAFAAIDRFVVYSRMERELYAETFQLPVERFSFMRWGVAPPITAPGPRKIARPYVASLGGEARDYRTLCDAARRLPNVHFVLIVRPFSLDGIDVPPNVEVHVNLPWNDAWSYVWHAEAALVPLRSSATPNGHVSIVGGMHIGKAQVATDSSGIRDYLKNESTALLVPAEDAKAFAAAIERLMDEPLLRGKVGRAAQDFAATHCSERVTIESFRRFATELALERA